MFWRVVLCRLSLAVLCITYLRLAAAPVYGADAAALESAIKPLVEAHRGDVAVAVKHLQSGVSYSHRADEPMPTASLIKFPVMVEAYRQAGRGDVDLDELITLREEDKVPGSGLLSTHFSAGAQLSLRDAIRLMIAYSDNTATNLVLDRIGIGAVAESMQELGLPNTKIHAKVFRRDTSVFPERSRKFGLGSTTAAETIRLYEMLHAGDLVDAASCEAMKQHLLHCQNRTKIRRLLPSDVEIAHKGGAVSAARSDAGIVYSPAGPIAICVLTANNADRSFDDDNAAHLLCARIARAAYDHFNPAGDVKAASGPPAVLKMGAGGRLVEELQRTLNARLSPSPEIAVDGDFGPQTQQAVRDFQSSQKLPASGEVDEKTWQALGPLVSGDEPVPSPEVVNAEKLPLLPPEPLDGPPLVTCKGWVIADGRTGDVVWSSQPDKRLDFASTTKIMTAYLVLRLAESDPSVLAEEVVFSPRADATIGSTAGVRAGERLTVGELLYGLLLPSGNDASVALAEHFGARLAPSGESVDGEAGEPDPLNQFVAAMNRAAAELDMTRTHYENPHGLTAEGHRSTARDLARLAHAAMQLERFREYVSTRQRGATLTSSAGYTRNVIWKNTNRLLPREGYRGVKTGTTRAAGACLVSHGARDGEELLIVVLGAASSDARYVDTRNLFRWGWSQRLSAVGR